MKRWFGLLTLAFAATRLDALPWIETAQLVHAGGSADDRFGFSVAIDGDVAVVARPNNGPFAAVFVRSGSSWTEAANLVTTDGEYLVGYGESVAISGDTIVIGEPGFNEVTGKAYVFVRPSGGWAGTILESAQLVDPAGTPLEQFGVSVSISGNTIVAGAHPGVGGAVFVFERPRSGWSGSLGPSARLESASAVTVGFSVGISGDTVVSGDYGEGHLWVKPSSGWSGVLAESAELRPAGILGNVSSSVAIDGSTAVVTSPGALYLDSQNETTRVSYVFEEPSTGWSGTLNEAARLVPSAGKLNVSDGNFGYAVSFSSDTVVVGSPGLRVFPFSSNDGGAFIFVKPSSGWSGDVGEKAKILRIDNSAKQSLLGWSVGVSGSTILLGAPSEPLSGNPSQGAAHVFDLGLNPTVTASFSPGSVLTNQASTLSLTVTNPNATGFIWDLTIGTPLFPANLFIAGTPNTSTTCFGFFESGAPGDGELVLVNGDPILAGGSCTVTGDVSSGIPGSYATAALPVFCDQGCDGAGSGPATLLVRLRESQTRFLVQGPIRVAPGVPVEFSFRVDGLQSSSIGPTGEVVLSDGDGHSCRSDISLSGEGACSLTFGSPGTFRIRAQYLGDLAFGGSSSPPEKVIVGSAGAAP